ncbi:MAG: DUF3352 domain-containing protein [Chloroflexota bacterium]
MTDQPPLQPDHEPAPAVTTSTVAPPPTSAPPSSRTRWFLALGAVALVAVGTIFAALALTGSSPAATVTGYVPANSVMYGEVRLDLPGDQRAEIGRFLSRFPGFADQAALDMKLDEVLDRLISDGTDGEQTFTRDIKPWFDGEMAFAVGPLPDAASIGDPTTAAASTRALVLLSVKDEALARTWFAGVMSKAGAAGVPETYQGTELTVFSDDSMPGARGAFALIGGKVAVAGDLASVKAAVDTGGSSGLVADADVVAAMAAMDGDHVGFMFVDLRSIVESALELGESMASTPPVNDAMLALVPDWSAFRLRVQGDGLVMDGVMPDVAGAPGPDTNRANALSGWAPASTIVLATGNEAGATFLDSIALMRQQPDLAEVFQGVDGAVGILGGMDAVLGWMGDSGIVISQGASAPEGGIVSIPTDATKARQFLTTIRSFATLGGSQAGITVREEDYAGTTITIIDLGSLEDLAGLAGGFGGGQVPLDPSTAPLPSGNVEIAYAATDQVVVIGSGPGFVRSVLDAGAGASLADDVRFTGLVGRVGAEHTGLSFVDIAAIRTLVEGRLSEATPAERAEYEESVKPFLTPFDALIASSVAGSDLDAQHIVITAK